MKIVARVKRTRTLIRQIRFRLWLIGQLLSPNTWRTQEVLETYSPHQLADSMILSTHRGFERPHIAAFLAMYSPSRKK